jgi:carbon-monoxide dehydrogenase medium subunit
MIPQAFEYDAPATLEEAIGLLQKYGDEAKILSGGHSLLPMMKLRLATPERLIDINGIPGLSYITEDGEYLKIGSMTRESELEDSELLQKKYPIFGDVGKLIADPQVRNLGTIGGNLAHGDAANDHPAVMLAFRAEIEATGPDGNRAISIDEFFHGFYMTALQPQEILTEIRIPVAKPRTGSAYHKLERKVGDYATAGAAVVLTLDDDAVVQYAGIGLTNVNVTPLRASRSEEALVGQRLTDEVIRKAAKFAAEDCNPSSDLRGDEAYKRHITGVLVNRMIRRAAERAKD